MNKHYCAVSVSVEPGNSVIKPLSGQYPTFNEALAYANAVKQHSDPNHHSVAVGEYLGEKGDPNPKCTLYVDLSGKTRPPPDQTETTATQFVASFFADDTSTVPYDTLPGSPAWSEWVEWTANAGRILERVVQEEKLKGWYIEEWYHVLEESVYAFTKDMEQNGAPEYERLADPFRAAIHEHSSR